MPLENTFGKVPRDAVVEVGVMCMYVNLLHDLVESHLSILRS
jgi:hypothetical protein